MTQEEALHILKTGRNVYLTGSAGSGKTYTLNRYIKYLRDNGVEPAVTASTGIAATHLGGVTIHSWSGIGVRDTLTDYDIDNLEEKSYLWKRFEKTNVLIMDEVSMLHDYRLDLVDRVCKSFKRNTKPFGGMQIIFSGDFFQLPPVTRGPQTKNSFAYLSKAWQEADPAVCYLSEQFRQTEDKLTSILNDIRNNTVTVRTLELLSSRVVDADSFGDDVTKLYTHNINVDSVNGVELSKIAGEEAEYVMESKGRDFMIDILKKSCLAPERLVLKNGARVMFVKNNHEDGYVNGSLGTVEGFDEEGFPLVRLKNGNKVSTRPVEWKIEEDGKTKALIRQLPLRLAWAITVHKSQGMSLDAALMDLTQSFEKGMGYVALSRLRTLEGLNLLGFNEMALLVHPDISEVDISFKEKSQELQKGLEKKKKEEREKLEKEFLSKIAPFGKGKKKDAKIATHILTGELLKEGKDLDEIADIRALRRETVIDHIEKLIKEGVSVDITYLKKKHLPTSRFLKIEKEFKKSFKLCGDYRMAPVKNALGAKFSYEDIRLARLFIDKK